MHGASHDLAGKRFAVFGHEDRLGVAVKRAFEKRSAHVEPIAKDEIKAKLRAASFDCLLALDDDHEANVRAALVASEAAPELPVVIRAFDPELADEIESDLPGDALHIRRAYSVAHLAAPDFVAAALLDREEKNVVTVRLGDEYVNVCQIRVRRPSRRWLPRGGRLAGRTPAKVFADLGCQVLARRWPTADWREPGDTPLREGEEVLLGGRLHDVLDVAWRQKARRRPGGGRPLPSQRRRHPLVTAWWSLKEARTYLTTQTTLTLCFLLFLVLGTVLLTPVDGPAAAFHLWVATALGNTETNDPDQLRAVVGGFGLLAGCVALGIGISLMSAHFIDRRLEEAMRQRARRVRRHVVVVGLDDVGLRIAQLLDDIGVPCVVLDTESATEQESRRRGHRLRRSPVIPGQLSVGLRAAGVHRASSLIATSTSNLLNVEACLRAKRDGPSEIHTIARIFDDDDDDLNVERSAGAFGVDRAMAAVTIAARAFVDAALSDEALRQFAPDGRAMSALRWPYGQPVGSRQMQRWHDDGVRLLAVRREGEHVDRPGSEIPGLAEDESGILAGPEAAIGRVLRELRQRAPLTEPPALRIAS
jgi:voltage-gated potassium channel Kch